MELIIQKLTRSWGGVRGTRGHGSVVARLTEKDGRRRERWQKIAREAAKQSGRTVVPRVEAPLRFEEMLRRLDGFEAVLTPWEEAQGYGLRRFSQQWPQVRNLALIVGPEGGRA